MRQTIYLDMDGVLADFDAALRTRGVANNETNFIHLPKDQWTPPQVELDRQVRECMEAPDFWNNIPLMEGAKGLWQYAMSFRQVFVLTALPRETAQAGLIEAQKRAWIQRYFGPFPDENVLVVQRADKKKYATQGAVLVDDMLVNCREWNGAGGTAVVFYDCKDAIHQLTLLTGKPELRQKTSPERKAEPIHSAIMTYHPDAMAAHARLSKAGNDKHNPGQPLHWAREKSGDHLDCAARHMLTPDAIDPETGETELTAAFWRLGCALQLQQERLLKEKGIMPYSGIVPSVPANDTSATVAAE